MLKTLVALSFGIDLPRHQLIIDQNQINVPAKFLCFWLQHYRPTRSPTAYRQEMFSQLCSFPPTPTPFPSRTEECRTETPVRRGQLDVFKHGLWNRHHIRQTFLDPYGDFWSDFPTSVITSRITLLKELRTFEEKSSAAKRYMSGHALVICSSSVAVLCWCGQLTWPWWPGFEWPTFLKRAGWESSFTLAFWSFSRESVYL